MKNGTDHDKMKKSKYNMYVQYHKSIFLKKKLSQVT